MQARQGPDGSSMSKRLEDALERHSLSLDEYASLENSIIQGSLLVRLARKLKQATSQQNSNQKDLRFVEQQLQWMNQWFFNHNIKISEQECQEVRQELIRLSFILKLCRLTIYLQFCL